MEDCVFVKLRWFFLQAQHPDHLLSGLHLPPRTSANSPTFEPLIVFTTPDQRQSPGFGDKEF